ncbi:MAG: Sec-independent protein translocase subunit TatA [Pseudonocardia sp.]
MPHGSEWLILLLVVVILFGAKKLPEMARSLGQSARVLKSEMKGMQDDDEARAKTTGQPAALPPAAAAPLPQPQPAEGSGSPDTPR